MKLLDKILNKLFSFNVKGMIKANEMHWIIRDIMEAKKIIYRSFVGIPKPIDDKAFIRLRAELAFRSKLTEIDKTVFLNDIVS